MKIIFNNKNRVFRHLSKSTLKYIKNWKRYQDDDDEGKIRIRIRIRKAQKLTEPEHMNQTIKTYLFSRAIIFVCGCRWCFKMLK